ncbi:MULTISPECIES: hypothetical protein [Halorhodospira]|uniref:hypothetical protein n=1 Tax=Halorhodospira TaxID=85108 RepID=UPI001EE8EFF3|nr:MULTISPECIES: hypothetical protein [Halorhodospira]MCG5529239.1 hypothetical protein [Halorhodospira halophila]MCG5543088.1 hypothetical protein [Halorhodospira sp. 9628]MCG5543095.1 hypothetical protein [Halorhodospira sp. 9628]
MRAFAGVLVDVDEKQRPILTTEEHRRLGRRVMAGIGISITGTVVWGFGDLVGEALTWVAL